MKFTKNLFALLLTAVLVFTMSIPAFAAVTTDVVTVEAGKTVSLTYKYTDVAGIYGVFALSNPDMISSLKITIPELGLEEVEYNEKDGRFSYFLSDNMTFDIVLEVVVAATAKAGDKCEVTFKHEAVSEDGVLPEEENLTVDTITIVVEETPVALDYSKLEALIASVDELAEDEYTTESWAAMLDVLADAEALIGNAKTQDEIDDMVDALQAAIDALVKRAPVVELDSSQLVALIEDAKNLVEDEYTEDSWKAMADVLADAEALVGNAKTQDEIDDMVDALQAAIDALVKKTPVVVELDYSKLEALIDDANALVEDEYTEDSWKAMSEVLAGAEALIGNAETQKEIDDMVAALQAAIDALVKKTPVVVELDYSKLEELVASVDKLNEENYTEDSWAAMLEILEKAQELLKNKNAESQNEIDTMVKDLQAAIDALVGKYGDNSTMVYAVVAMIIAAVATVLVLKTRKKVRN